MEAATAALISTGGWLGWERPLSMVGAGAVATVAGAAGCGAGAAATGTGAGAGAGSAWEAAAGCGAGASAVAAPPSSIDNISVPTGTVAPSSTFNSLIIPATGEGISAFTLSV